MSGHRSEDLVPQDTGYVRLTGHGSPQQPPATRAQLVLTPGVEPAGPGMEIIRTPQTIEEFVGFVTRSLDAGAQRPLGHSPVVLRASEVFALFELVNELGYVYAGTSLGNLATRITSLLRDRSISAHRANEVAAARSVVMPLAATRVTPEDAIGGLWRVDDATGRPVGLISDGYGFSASFAPTFPYQRYDVGDLVPIASTLDERAPTLEQAVDTLEHHIRALASSEVTRG